MDALRRWTLLGLVLSLSACSSNSAGGGGDGSTDTDQDISADADGTDADDVGGTDDAPDADSDPTSDAEDVEMDAQDDAAEDAVDADDGDADEDPTEDAADVSADADAVDVSDAADAIDVSDVSDADVSDADDSDADASDASDIMDEEIDECVDGVFCGSPAVCCESGNECIEGACLPACESGVRCDNNSVCCDVGDVCLVDACAAPTNDCLDAFDCLDGFFCEPTIGQCLPQPDPLVCEIVPSFTEISVDVEWLYDAEQVISIPVVADIDGDGVSEVVLNLTSVDGGSWPEGRIAALDGVTGMLEWEIPHAPASGTYGSHGRSTIALGDVSGDGLPDVIYASREVAGRSVIVAVDGSGDLLWTSHDAFGTEVTFDVENGAATLANFDDDAAAEVVFGATLIDNDGLVVWNEDDNGAVFGTNQGYIGGISAVADIDDDGQPEIVSGRDAWDVRWTAGDPPTVSVSLLWSYPGADGYPAIADLDLDGDPEVVLVGQSTVSVLNGQTGELLCGTDPSDAACAMGAPRTQPLALPGGSSNNRGGPPTIADFDGDGRPEIGIAGGHAYTVYDLHRDSEDLVYPAGDPEPALGALYVRWSEVTRDLSSNATGSAVFDFQGDGIAEVIYGDECYMRAYSGLDGTVLLQIESSSATIHEYPVVVDVDGDRNSEILIVANDSNSAGNCGSIPGYTGRRGLLVYGDAGDGWVPTRQVWTQHAYHVSNATSAGNVPFVEDDNWLVHGLNNYRQNVQTTGVFNAPNLRADLSFDHGKCPDGTLGLVARITNEGSLGVAAGVPVAFYRGSDATGEQLGVVITTEPLLPGASTSVTLEVPLPPMGMRQFYVEVDNDGSGGSAVSECIEDDNGSAIDIGECNKR